VEEHGGIAHLYFHTWEIEELGDWHKLELALRAVGKRQLTPVTNGTLFRLWSQPMAEGRRSSEPVDGIAVRPE